MSNVSGVHDVVAFDSKISRPLDGQRLCKVIYKTPKSGVKKASKCVSIPVVTVLSDKTYQAMEPFMIALYKSAQDGIIRDAVDAGTTVITDDSIADSAVIAYLTAEAEGSRITKEVVTAWFGSSLNDALTIAFGDKLGVSDTPTVEQTKQIENAVQTYKDKFTSLAGGKTYYDPATAVKLLKVLELCGDDDDIGNKFTARLIKMKDAPTGADMLGL